MSTLRAIVTTAIPAALPAAVLACAGAARSTRVHPERLHEPPRCGDCHDGSLTAFDHGPGFATTHGTLAPGAEGTCALCHQTDFCAGCHGKSGGLTPAARRPDRFGAGYPHTGDYLRRHRIDGRQDPASCVACHGRANDRRCRECHR